VSVNYDYDPTAKFTGLKTFMWLPDPEPVERHTLVLKRVERAAKRELESKGMVLVPDNPDFLVSVHGERESKISVTDWGFSYGGSGIDVYQYEEGTIFIDIVDPDSKELMWRGTARGITDPDLSPEERTEKINNAVTSILVNFPPDR
jgi:hypothetical protein